MPSNMLPPALLARPSAVPDHIAAFGGPTLFRSRTLFDPNREGEGGGAGNGGGSGGGGEQTMTRAQWVEREAAEQAKKSVEQLARDNAGLQYDLRVVRDRFNPETQVAISKEDAAAFEAYRTEFPTPKEAKDARTRLSGLEEKDQLRSYDEARTAALAEFPDLPAGFQAIIPTAEELKKRPGGAAQLTDVEFLKAEVARVATAYGAQKQNSAENTNAGGPPPTTVTAGQDSAQSAADAAQKAREMIQRRHGTTT